MKGTPPAHRLALWFGAAGLAALTLFPGDAVWRALGWVRCLACGDLQGLDAIHNFLLFIPVGVILFRLAGRWSVAVWSGVLISVGIELLQAAIPGREASVLDVVTNAAGTSLGVALSTGLARWLRPSREAAGRWSLAIALAFVGLLTVTGVLAQPALMPGATLYGQWAPPRANFDPFTGRVMGLESRGISLPHGEVPDQAGVRAAWARGPEFAVDVDTGAPIGTRPVLIARLVAVDDEMFVVARQNERFLVRIRLRVTDAGLRSPVVAIPAPPGRLERAHLEAGIAGGHLTARVSDSSGTSSRSLPLEVTLGWAFLLPVEVVLGDWLPLVSALWVGLLALPAGFYMAAGARGTRDAASRVRAAAVPAVLLAAGLGLVPLLVAAAPSHWSSWGGTAAGVLAGWWLSVRVSRGHGESHNAPARPSP